MTGRPRKTSEFEKLIVRNAGEKPRRPCAKIRDAPRGLKLEIDRAARPASPIA
jgi:hypothetical protein